MWESILKKNKTIISKTKLIIDSLIIGNFFSENFNIKLNI